MSILEVCNLSKQYKQVNAVNGISFVVQPGTCFGLLGPNGAGKTTTIEMIEGITEPSAGVILYQGKPRDALFKQEAGIQFQETSLTDYITVKETLELFASLYKKPFPLSQVIDLCKLQPILKQRTTLLSGGQKKRLLLALALINDPKIVFLDEPTTGLDPQARHNFWQLISDIKSQGKTVILTTHYMEEAELLCDELIIMDAGIILDQGSPKALLEKHFNRQRVTLNKRDIQTSQLSLSEKLIEEEDRLIILSENIESTLSSLKKQGIDLTSISIETPNLEDLFLKLTGHTLRQ
ncbi:MAG TPA: ABC transporter ATP-binding protein [Arenicellales bacterium]|jgi:ABC-2 type transport system ATP-binding protein|nr:ABC transporter ATP-binding protein [Arenicellales bacterium]|tara:strand:- start:1464 stop:2345 length:882 start_codon:yes stop_codon:yes gene_type:complete